MTYNAASHREILAAIPRDDNGQCVGGSRPPMPRRRFIQRILMQATGNRCTVCGEPAIAGLASGNPSRGVMAHIKPAGNGRNGYFPGNLMWACESCNDADKGIDLTDSVPHFALADTIPLVWGAGEIHTDRDADTERTRRAAIRRSLSLTY
jgi:hypothetical protein